MKSNRLIEVEGKLGELRTQLNSVEGRLRDAAKATAEAETVTMEDLENLNDIKMSVVKLRDQLERTVKEFNELKSDELTASLVKGFSEYGKVKGEDDAE